MIGTLADTSTSTNTSDPVVGFLILIAAVAVYFLPTLIAMGRHKANIGTVIVVNLFLGFTLIGWVVALSMAFGERRPVAAHQGRH